MAKLSDQNRARAVGYVESGRSVRYVATTFHVSPSGNKKQPHATLEGNYREVKD